MGEILLSGLATGGSVIDAGRVFELGDVASGACQISAVTILVRGAHGYASGSGGVALWAPDTLYGCGRLMGRIEVICTPRPISQDAQLQRRFRWGHAFGPGDLEFIVTDDFGRPLGASCISFTMYQMVQGCSPKQMGVKGRKPVTKNLGVYYATGVAGECGQPGLWKIRWCYQQSFGGPPLYGDCYFYVLDSVLCPVPGDTLPRVTKWGWD